MQDLITYFFGTIRHLSESIFDSLALLIAPLFPAALLGSSVYVYFLPERGHTVALIVAIAGAFAMEAAGFWGFKAYSLTGAWLPPVLYVTFGSIGTAAVEWGHPQRIAFGILGFILVAVVYYSINIAATAQEERDDKRQERKADKELSRKIRAAKAKAAIDQQLVQTGGAIAVQSGAIAVKLQHQLAQKLQAGATIEPQDETDAAILQLLAGEPGATMTKVKEVSGLSHNGAKGRVKKLLESVG